MPAGGLRCPLPKSLCFTASMSHPLGTPFYISENTCRMVNIELLCRSSRSSCISSHRERPSPRHAQPFLDCFAHPLCSSKVSRSQRMTAPHTEHVPWYFAERSVRSLLQRDQALPEQGCQPEAHGVPGDQGERPVRWQSLRRSASGLAPNMKKRWSSRSSIRIVLRPLVVQVVGSILTGEDTLSERQTQ